MGLLALQMVCFRMCMIECCPCFSELCLLSESCHRGSGETSRSCKGASSGASKVGCVIVPSPCQPTRLSPGDIIFSTCRIPDCPSVLLEHRSGLGGGGGGICRSLFTPPPPTSQDGCVLCAQRLILSSKQGRPANWSVPQPELSLAQSSSSSALICASRFWGHLLLPAARSPPHTELKGPCVRTWLVSHCRVAFPGYLLPEGGRSLCS